MTSIALIINTHSGAGSKEKELEALIKTVTYSQFSLIPFNAKQIKSIVRKLSEEGYTTIVAGGGDGTVSAVAGAITDLGLQIKLAVLPLGTFNHFARDIGMPLTLPEALDVIVKGKTTYIDIGKVNDTYFINNSSLGLYPKIVKYREEFRRKGWHKGLAFIGACISILKKNTSLTIEFDLENKKTSKRAQFIFIGNNKYEMVGLLSIGQRKYLDQGALSLCIAKDVSNLKLLSFGFHALKGTLVEQKDFNVVGLKECIITSKKTFVDVSHDGEISKMKTPLHYQIMPKALLVIIP